MSVDLAANIHAQGVGRSRKVVEGGIIWNVFQEGRIASNFLYSLVVR